MSPKKNASRVIRQDAATAKMATDMDLARVPPPEEYQKGSPKGATSGSIDKHDE